MALNDNAKIMNGRSLVEFLLGSPPEGNDGLSKGRYAEPIMPETYPFELILSIF
jgi:hypothetical protein